MDNLAHALTGPVLTSLLSRKLFNKYKKRAFLASAVVVNLPDADVVLAFLGGETYFFHHRGITHSFIGLILMIPIGMWFFNKIMGRAYTTSPEDYLPLHRQIILITTLLVIGHFFLDYLTTWGTMFLYPLLMERYSFPLMFIIDPRYWLIGISSCIALGLFKSSSRGFVVAGWSAVVISFAYWGFGISAKAGSEKVYRANSIQSESIVELDSYPSQTAPKGWIVVATHQEQIIADDAAVGGEGDVRDVSGNATFFYTQAGVKHRSFLFNSFLFQSHPYEETEFTSYPIPAKYSHDRLCREMNFDDEAYKVFSDYRKWSERTVCEVAQLEGQTGCQCSSLKYFVPAGNGFSNLGNYWIGTNGEAHLRSRF